MKVKTFFEKVLLRVGDLWYPIREDQAGMTTVEYAIGTLAAAAFAGLLLLAVKEGGVKEMIITIIKQALTV